MTLTQLTVRLGLLAFASLSILISETTETFALATSGDLAFAGTCQDKCQDDFGENTRDDAIDDIEDRCENNYDGEDPRVQECVATAMCKDGATTGSGVNARCAVPPSTHEDPIDELTNRFDSAYDLCLAGCLPVKTPKGGNLNTKAVY